MKNEDMIAFFQLTPNQFSGGDAVEFLDFTGRIGDIEANSYRIAIRMELQAGWYCGRIRTLAGAFDMSTAMIEMVRVPDGKRMPVGPWDLDHIHNVMAMPMARAWVNGKFKGGLWFDLPGPQEIAEGRLYTEFGFEAEAGETELVLELIESDRSRLSWGRIESLELRKDDRIAMTLTPHSQQHPYIFVTEDQVAAVRRRWAGNKDFDAMLHLLRTQPLAFQTDNSQGTLELACLVYLLTGDQELGAKAKKEIVALAQKETWSSRPDPLLMGGDNDRGIGDRLYHCALAWDYMQPLFNAEEKKAILAKVDEYLIKSYDFTLLQRSYMGYPTIEPHSLGTWNGIAIACMAFYADLESARKSLPLYHGLFVQSLELFPSSGKAAWATYFPFHMVRYLAAAGVFAGESPALNRSLFLDHLGEALITSFDVPNSQEMQRGVRTREYRYIVAFLCRFHPTHGIREIYQSFVDRERHAAGDLMLGIFDVLYAPEGEIAPAPFRDRPLYARDVGDIIAGSHGGSHHIGLALSGGPKAGRAAVFTLMPHNREFTLSMGAIDVTVDGSPVLCNINIGTYGINSALTNTISFNEGSALTDGQYLNGEVAPEKNGMIRRCLIDDRFLFVHVVLTHSLKPELGITRADRLLVFDRQSGAIVLSDAFAGSQSVTFATHLHCSGSITTLGDNEHRLTGGQANLIIGIKYDIRGPGDEEKGELFTTVLGSSGVSRIATSEPTWVPAYIYGLNATGKEDIHEGHYPHYHRWRLEMADRVKEGSFLVGISPRRGQVRRATNNVIELSESSAMRLGPGRLQALGLDCEGECLLWDSAARCVTGLGVRRLQHGQAYMEFRLPIDFIYQIDRNQGVVYSTGIQQLQADHGFRAENWQPIGDDQWRTDSRWRCTIHKR